MLNKFYFLLVVVISINYSDSNGQNLKSLSNRKVIGIISLGPSLWAAKNCAAFGPGGNIGILVNNRCITADFANHPLGDCHFIGGGVNYFRTDFLRGNIIEVALGFRLGFWFENNRNYWTTLGSGFVTGPMVQITFGKRRVSPVIQYSGLIGFGEREEDEVPHEVNTVRFGNHFRLGVQVKI